MKNLLKSIFWGIKCHKSKKKDIIEIKSKLKLKEKLTSHALLPMAFPWAQNSWSEILWSVSLSQSDRVITERARTCNLGGNPKIIFPLGPFVTLEAPQPEIKHMSLTDGDEINECQK